MTSVSQQQMTLSFEPGLSERHRSLLGCVRETIYRSQKAIKAVAADMDLSESALSRKLSENPDDRRAFSVDDLEAAIVATGDATPVHYLIEKFLQNPEQKRARAADLLSQLLPHVIALANEAGINQPMTTRKKA